MSTNNQVYKGFKVSAKVRRTTVSEGDHDGVGQRFLATASITQVSAGMGSRRILPAIVEESADAPQMAITLALSSAREAIDSMSTFVKSK